MISFETFWKYAAPLVKAVAILIIGHFIVVYLMKLIKRAFDKTKMDLSLSSFMIKALNIVMHILIILSALNSIGVSTTGILAALSAAAVGVTVALKDSLGNIAGGILLLISPRFSSGDYISAGGDEGTVINVDLLHTTVRTFDNRQVSIPNGVLINSHIVNFSREKRRRVDITFPVSYETDIEKAKKTAYNAIIKHPLVLSEPEPPTVRVTGYGESSVNIITRSWCKTADYWDVYFDLMEQVRAELEKEGMGVPYNKIDVNIINKREEK